VTPTFGAFVPLQKLLLPRDENIGTPVKCNTGLVCLIRRRPA